MPRLFTVAFAFTALVLAEAAKADFFQLTVSSNLSINEVRTMLRSDDPRLVGWGAYFASLNGDDVAVTLMLQQVERWTASGPIQGDVQGDRRFAISELLYALIQRDEVVPPELLSDTAESFPLQTAILLTRLPPSGESLALLEKWYGYSAAPPEPPLSDTGRRVLPRIAAMILAKYPPPGYAASILSKTADRLEISVRSDPKENPAFKRQETRVSVPSVVASDQECEDVPYPQNAYWLRDWPPLFQYVIEENPQSDKGGSMLIEAPGDRITYRRLSIAVKPNPCYLPDPLNEKNRRNLLVEMAGPENVNWPSQSNEVLIWKDNSQFTRDLENRTASEEARLHYTVQALLEKGLLTKREAVSNHVHFALKLHDERDRLPALPPLPEIH